VVGGQQWHRPALAFAALAVGLGGLLAALGLDDRSRGVLPEAITPSPAKVSVAYEPGAGAEPVNPTGPVSVTATDGELRRVTLAEPGGKPVAGRLSPDRRTWTSSEPMGYNRTYTWSGEAADADGRTVALGGTVTTVKPNKLLRATVNIGDGRVVGIAAPIEVKFNGKVADRAAAEKALSVQTSVPTEGAWGWLPDEGGGSRVHWRPKDYWKPYTKVTVKAPLFGVDYGGGSWGTANVSSSFSVGRGQVVKADTKSFRMTVIRDGQQVADYPASYGLDSDPNRNTRSGIHVVTEKFTDKRMTSQQYGYDVMEKWAVRMSNNGEFIHANPQTVGVQGSSNVSHGCVNLSTEDARAYYDTALYGDPVEVTNSGVPLSAKDGDIWDWTLSWPQWQRLSALPDS
jgi:lipoprotein-anchoring transpeptidase ErfK/SrfK